MPETRVIGAASRKIGGGASAAPQPSPAPPQPASPAPRRRGRALLVAAVVVLVLAAAALYLLRPTDSAAAPEEPEPGYTVAVEPRSINLADGRYLRLGFAIQLAAEAEEIPTAQATDIAIGLYSGRTVAEVNDPERRSELQAELTDRLVGAYGEEVMAVYLTEFVTQ